MKPGVHYGISKADYFRDPCERPSLNATTAKLLTSASPLHAWTQHPRLNPDYMDSEDPKFDVGTAAHALLLEGENAVTVVDAADWRTSAAKDERDAARRAGRIPMLANRWDEVQAMAAAVSVQLARHHADPPLFTDGKPEVTLVWEEPGDVICRARCDWLRDDYRAIDDLKSTGKSANPERWSRSLFDMGFDTQAAFYARGLKALTGADPEFRFVVVETSPPFALSVVGLGPDAIALANEKVTEAIDKWRTCLTADSWPAYPTQVCWAELPSYEMTRWMARQEEEVAA